MSLAMKFQNHGHIVIVIVFFSSSNVCAINISMSAYVGAFEALPILFQGTHTQSRRKRILSRKDLCGVNVEEEKERKK